MVTVNDLEASFNSPGWFTCWICGHPRNHWGVVHSVAMGDGLTRYDIVGIMNANGWEWRPQ